MDRTITITESEYSNYMYLVEMEVQKCNKVYRDLTDPDPVRPHLFTPEERQQSANYWKERQHELFNKWYNMNKAAQAAGISWYNTTKLRELGTWIIGASSYKDVIKEW